MLKESNFNGTAKKHMKTLALYVPVVARVHGEHHPEFHRVREVYEQLAQKVKASGAQKPDLRDEFLLLREITGHYTVPDDVCESYEAVYRLLAELDKAYES